MSYSEIAVRSSDSRIKHSLLILFFSLAGSAINVYLKFVSFWLVYSPAIDAVVIASGLIFIYAAIVSWAPYFRLLPEEAGDNCYYLGFIYTISSIAVTLAVGDLDADLIGEATQGLGVGLASTVTGVVLRLMFSQLRRDMMDIEREARTQLAEAARALRNEMRNTAVVMQDFRRESEAMLSQAFQEIRQAVDTTLSAATGKFEEVMGGATASIASSYEGLAERADEIHQSTAAITGAFNGLASQMEKVELPTDLIERQLAPVVTLMANTAKAMAEALDKDTEARDGARQQTAQIKDASANFVKALELASQAAQGQEVNLRKFDDLDARLAKTVETLNAAHGAFTQIIESAKEDLSASAALRKEITAVRDELERSRVRS